MKNLRKACGILWVFLLFSCDDRIVIEQPDIELFYSSTSICNCYNSGMSTLSNLIEANISQDHFKNPFSTAIDLYGNSGGSISSGTYTIPIRNADGMFLDSSDNELYVIVRYKGDPAPISAITLSYS